MSIHKTKQGFEVRWREGSRNRSRSFDLKGDAVKFQAHVRRQSQLGEVVPSRTGSMTLAEYFLLWLEARRSLEPKTRSLYKWLFEAHVLDQIGYAPLASLTPERMEQWQADRLAAGAGPVAVSKAAKLLHQVFKKAVKQGKLPRNPVADLEGPKHERREIVPATPKQVEAMRNWFLECEREGDATLLSLMAYGGLRPGEALALKWEDFSQGKQLWVCRSLEDDGSFKTTKNRVNRLVELPEAAAQDLLTWRRETGGAQALIFPRAKDGQGWTKTDRNNWRRRWFSQAAKAAGLGDFPPKNLRHSCASLMIAAGHRPTEVAEALGHSLAVSVNVYQRLMQEMKGQPIRSVDEMIAEARSGVTSAAEPATMGTQEIAPASGRSGGTATEAQAP